MVQQTEQREANIPEPRCVVLLYEDTVVREEAVRFCERLSQTAAAASELTSWAFPLLEPSRFGHDAAQKAAAADIVVFAMNAEGDLPEGLKLWIEHWLNKRGEREGALVGVLAQNEPHGMASFREIYLRHIARRAGMDYLSQAAPTLTKAIPDSIDSFSERAARRTSVLDSILHKHPESTPRLGR